MEKAMAPHSSTLAWKIPWTEEPGKLQSVGSLRVGHNWAASLSLFTFMHWRRKWQPTPVFLLENPRDRGAWWAAIYGVAQSRTRLKWLSSSRTPWSLSGFQCNPHFDIWCPKYQTWAWANYKYFWQPYIPLRLKALAGGCCFSVKRLEKESKEANHPHITTK